METTVKQLLWREGFKYQERVVVERLTYYLSLGRETDSSLGMRLHFLREAANEWMNGDSDDYATNLFLTVVPYDVDSLCVVTEHGISVAWLNLYLLMSEA